MRLLTTRAGRTVAGVTAHGFWWLIFGMLTAAGHPSPWMLLDALILAGLAVSLRDFGDDLARHATALAAFGLVAAVSGWVLWVGRDHAWCLATIPAFTVALVVALRTLPPMGELSPEVEDYQATVNADG